MNLWTIFRYLYCLCSTYGLFFLFPLIKIPVVAVIVSADVAVWCSIWFPTNSCTWFTHTDTCMCCIRMHRPCAHRPLWVVYKGLCFCLYTSEFLSSLKCKSLFTLYLLLHTLLTSVYRTCPLGVLLCNIEFQTSAHLMRKVVTAANRAKEHANIEKWEGIASAIRGWEWRGLDWEH